MHVSASPVATRRLLRALVGFGVSAMLLTILTGNVFALHVGMAATQGPPAATATAAAGAEGWISEGAPAAPDLGPGRPGQHVLHVIGACVALLAAAVLLLWGLGRSVRDPRRRPPERPNPLAAAPGKPFWHPPPCPPVTSPVIRC